jgi:hypothetical protein
VRLVTWNVAGRVSRQPEQAEVVAAIAPDVVALQEVTARTAPLWRAALGEMGMVGCETTLDDALPTPARRRLAVLTAAREPLGRLAPPDVPWPERLLCCRVGEGLETPSGRFTATARARRAGRSRRTTAAAGGSTTFSSRASARWPPRTRTTGAAAA